MISLRHSADAPRQTRLLRTVQLALLVLTLGMSAPGLVLGQDEVPQPEAPMLLGDAQAEADLVGRVNAMRNVVGRRGLVRDPRLDEAAGAHAAELSITGALSHVSTDGATPAERVARVAITATKVGENVARARNAAEAHEQWVQSEAHRENMLDADFSHIGVAAVRVGADGPLVVVELLVTIPTGVEAPEVPSAPPVPEASAPSAAEPALEMLPSPETAATPAAPDAPPQPAEAEPAPGAPALQVPGPSVRRVAGYWVHHFGTWYYYPLPTDARPGQQLIPVAMPQGPPAALLTGGQGRVVYRGDTTAVPAQLVAPPPPVIAPQYVVPRYQPR